MSNTISKINVNDVEYDIISEKVINPNLFLNTNWVSNEPMRYPQWSYLSVDGSNVIMSKTDGFKLVDDSSNLSKYNVLSIIDTDNNGNYNITQSFSFKPETYYTLSFKTTGVILNMKTVGLLNSTSVVINGEPKSRVTTLSNIDLGGTLFNVITFKTASFSGLKNATFMFKGNDGSYTTLYEIKLEEGTIATEYVQNELDFKSKYETTKLNFDEEVFTEDSNGITIKHNALFAHEDGTYLPLTHPDLSTQANILDYKFMGNYVYEQLIPNSFLKSSPDSLYLFDMTDLLPEDFNMANMLLLDSCLIYNNGVKRRDTVVNKNYNEIAFNRDSTDDTLLYAKIIYTTLVENGGGNDYYN